MVICVYLGEYGILGDNLWWLVTSLEGKKKG